MFFLGWSSFSITGSTILSWNRKFPLIYDVKGSYTIHSITNQEAKYKLCRVREIKTEPKNVPYLYTSNSPTIHYPDPIVKTNDSVKLDINTGKIKDSINKKAAMKRAVIIVA